MRLGKRKGLKSKESDLTLACYRDLRIGRPRLGQVIRSVLARLAPGSAVVQCTPGRRLAPCLINCLLPA